VVHRPKRTLLRCESKRHALRSGGTRSLLSGRVSGDRSVAETLRRVPSGPHIDRTFRAADQKRWLVASADKPASKVGNRWRCWCIQPIGYRAEVAVVAEVKRFGSVGSGGAAVSEVRSPQRWQHPRERDIDEEPVEPATRHDLGACIGITRSARWGEFGVH
jgi:hypothetical protein